jgi:Spy/CpxP family protein refolding chaperone
MMGEMQGMLEHMQGMMEHMQGMLEHMQGMRGHGGMMRHRRMMGMGGMMGRRSLSMMAQEEDDEEESPPRGVMGRHMERLAQQLELTDEQQTQIRALRRNHAKEAIRLKADIGVLAVDVRQLLDTDPVDLPKVKQLFQSMAAKEADLRVAHVTLTQEINKLLTPDQQKQFRPMRERMGGMGGMRGRGQREK